MTLRRNLVMSVMALLILVVSAVGSFGPDAHAQGQTIGTADFRNAPQLTPGSYLDRIVTGDSAWYSVIYTNGTPYEFEVDFQGANPGTGFDLTLSFVAPTLTTVDGPAAVVIGNGVDYPAGHTNVWFLKVSLETSNQNGVEYPIIVSVDGVQSASLEACSDIDDCVLDDDYAAINVALAEATAGLEIARSQEKAAAVEAEIENLRGFAESAGTLAPAAQSRLVQAEAIMAQMCAPLTLCDEFPDPGSKTPVIGWIFGLGALAFGGFRVFKKLTTEPTEPTEPISP
ncbi:MAG: hypothetical protein ACKVK3_06735 [Acidimicrobiales bacterium]|jgi:hypothetical protein